MLALDTVLAAAFHFSVKWSPELQRNQSRDLMRYLICRLYDQSRGQLMNGQITLAQTTLALKLGLSRQWIGELLARLQSAGWISYYSPRLDNGLNGSTTFRIGTQFKRLLVMLFKSRPKTKKPTGSPVNNRWRFSPSKTMKNYLLSENKALSPETLEKIPILKTWLGRA